MQLKPKIQEGCSLQFRLLLQGKRLTLPLLGLSTSEWENSLYHCFYMQIYMGFTQKPIACNVLRWSYTPCCIIFVIDVNLYFIAWLAVRPNIFTWWYCFWLPYFSILHASSLQHDWLLSRTFLLNDTVSGCRIAATAFNVPPNVFFQVINEFLPHKLFKI